MGMDKSEYRNIEIEEVWCYRKFLYDMPVTATADRNEYEWYD
jgi:hypothetical protein